MRSILLALLASAGPACERGDKRNDTDLDTDSDTDTDTDGTDTPDPTFFESWTTEGVTFVIEDGSGTYTLGMAETAADSPDPWTGEDCLNGYTLSSGTVLLYCHPLSVHGGELSSGGEAGSLNEGSETVFTSALADVITYAAWSDDSGDCWTWGHDPSYYTGEGCTLQ